MRLGKVSLRYAKAMLTYAVNHGVEQEVYRSFKELLYFFAQFPDMRNLLDNPLVDKAKKLTVINTAAGHTKQTCLEFDNFVSMVLQNGRESYMESIARMYIDHYRKLKHIGVANLTTAVEVDEQTKERIRQKAGSLLHARMELSTKVNPDIIGGFVFDFNGYRLDAAISTRLNQVKQQLIHKNRRIV